MTEIRIYTSERDHRIDGSLLNANRSDLSALEQALELERLSADSIGVDELAAVMGRSTTWVHGRLAITNLSPNIMRTRLHPAHRDLNTPDLATTVATALGQLTCPDDNNLRRIMVDLGVDLGEHLPTEDERLFVLQESLLAEIESRGLGSSAARDFIRDITTNKGVRRGGAHRNKVVRGAQEPRKMRERLGNFARNSAEHSILAWENRHFKHAFDGSRESWAQGVYADLETAIRGFELLRNRLQERFPDLAKQSQSED